MNERKLIAMESAGRAAEQSVRLLLADPDIDEVFWWWKPETGARPPGPWSVVEGTRLFAVAERGCGIIGLAALSNIRRDEQYARVSCAIASAHRERGVGHWATTEVIRLGVRLDGLRHLETCIRAGNETSRVMLESLGFRSLAPSPRKAWEAPPESHAYYRLDLPQVPSRPRLPVRDSAWLPPALAIPA